MRSGNLVCFDTETHRIGPEHVMASGALPPGFPAVEIEGEHYWDGGLVSNTPLEWVVENVPRQHTLAFQVDLWSARGDFPRHMAEVETRRKEIVYSSRTRASTSSFKRMQRMRHAAAKLSTCETNHRHHSTSSPGHAPCSKTLDTINEYIEERRLAEIVVPWPGTRVADGRSVYRDRQLGAHHRAQALRATAGRLAVFAVPPDWFRSRFAWFLRRNTRGRCAPQIEFCTSRG